VKVRSRMSEYPGREIKTANVLEQVQKRVCFYHHEGSRGSFNDEADVVVANKECSSGPLRGMNDSQPFEFARQDKKQI